MTEAELLELKQRLEAEAEALKKSKEEFENEKKALEESKKVVVEEVEEEKPAAPVKKESSDTLLNNIYKELREIKKEKEVEKEQNLRKSIIAENNLNDTEVKAIEAKLAKSGLSITKVDKDLLIAVKNSVTTASGSTGVTNPSTGATVPTPKVETEKEKELRLLNERISRSLK